MAKSTKPLTFDARATIRAASGQAPQATILAYNGGTMRPPGWGDVVIDLAGIDASGQIAILVDHRNELEAVAGHGVAAIRQNALYVAGTLTDQTIGGRQVLKLHKTGFQFQASVGILPLKSKLVREGETIQVNGRTITAGASGLLLILASKLKEVSICTLGADGDTTVSIAARLRNHSMAKRKVTGNQVRQRTGRQVTQEDPEMDVAGELVMAGLRLEDFGDALPEDPMARQREVLARDAERAQEIGRICASHGDPIVEVNGERVSLQAHAIRHGLSPAAVTVAAEQAKMPQHGPAIQASRSGANSIEAIEAALLVRAGLSSVGESMLGERVMEQSRALHGASVLDLCRAALSLDGRQVPSNRDELIRAGLSTGSMPVALGNAVNKSVLAVYQEGRATWQSFCAVRPAADFKPHTSIRPSFLGQLEELGEGGEIKHGEFGEATFAWQIDTFAKMFSYDRKKLINDDLDVISETGPALGKMALRKVADLVYKTLIGAGAHFHADKKNLLAGGVVAANMGVDAVAAAIRMMRTQRDEQSNDLDIQPIVLVCAPEQETNAKIALESEFVERAMNVGTGNPTRKAVSLQVEGRLSNAAKFGNGANSNYFYLFGSQSDVPMVVGFLEGKTSPTIEFFGLDHTPKNLSVSWRCYFDFGAAMGDHRAAVKSDGVVLAE